MQTSFTADPAPMVYNDTLYLYAGDDSLCTATLTGFFMRYWKCYSTTDMANWTYRAIILPTSTVTWAGGDANAAQCIYRNGNFYFYFTSTYQGSQAVGVAVANNPLGPFTDIGQPLILGSQMTGCSATHGWRGLDPTVYIDDDGQAYLYWGNNVCYWVRLNTNMTSTSGSITCIAQNNTTVFGPDFEEAPWIYKRNGLWYLLYASSIPENIGYTTSSSPTGPWTFRSIISTAIANQTGNHPGCIDYRGNSYLLSFKDRTSGLPDCGQFRRAIYVERFTYNGDGTIPTVVFSTSGPPQIGNLNPYDTVQAETICWAEWVRARPCSEGGMYIDSINNGDFIKVKGVDFGPGANSFIARVASAASGGNIELRLDGQAGTLVGTCTVAG
ncbi:MAG: family 43 glycosylhydrolase, partial [Chitinispirillaceae bacterium]|nr:family 43 glycosylhydrolase [Chitinispirillaceae bacterium]